MFSSRSDSTSAPILVLLERITGRFGLEFDRGLARRAWYDSISQGATVAEGLAEVARLSGLRVEKTARAAKQIAARLDSECFVMVRDGELPNQERLTAVLDRNGKALGVLDSSESFEARFVSVSEVAKALGVDSVRKPAEGFVISAAARADEHEDAEEEAHHSHRQSPIDLIFRLLKPETRDVRAIVIYAIGVALLTLATPLAIESLVTTVAFGRLFQPLFALGILLFACLVLSGVLRALQTYVMEIIQRRLFVRAVSELSEKLPRARAENYDREHGPELVNRFFDIVNVQKACSLILLDGATLVLQLLVGLVVLAFYHPYLLGFDILVVGVIGFIVFVLGQGSIRTSIEESRSKYAVAGALEEFARDTRAFKQGGGFRKARETADRLARDYVGARSKHFGVLYRQVLFSLGFQALAGASLLGLGGWLVIEGQLTLGQLVAAELIVATVAGSVAKMGKHLEAYYDLAASATKLAVLNDLTVEPAGGELLTRDTAGIALRTRGLAYEYHDHSPVFQGLRLDLNPGDRVNLVGPSGSGKSTLLELIWGLREPSQGSVELDGKDIRGLRLESMRKQVALVSGIEVISDTIIANLRIARPEATLSEVREALEAVGLWEDVAALPRALRTKLTPSGSPLSKGQIRKLMFARALTTNPRLLLVDDLIDLMDDELVRMLTDETQPWTLIAVSRRGGRNFGFDGEIRLSRHARPIGVLEADESMEVSL